MGLGLYTFDPQGGPLIDPSKPVARVVGSLTFNSSTSLAGSAFVEGLQDGRPWFLLQPEETAAPQPEISFGYNGAQGNGWVYWSYGGVAQTSATLVLMVW